MTNFPFGHLQNLNILATTAYVASSIISIQIMYNYVFYGSTDSVWCFTKQTCILEAHVLLLMASSATVAFPYVSLSVSLPVLNN